MFGVVLFVYCLVFDCVNDTNRSRNIILDEKTRYCNSSPSLPPVARVQQRIMLNGHGLSRLFHKTGVLKKVKRVFFEIEIIGPVIVVNGKRAIVFVF